MSRTRIAVVGASLRAGDYMEAITGRHTRARLGRHLKPVPERNELVGICDPNPLHIDFHRHRLQLDTPAYGIGDFDRMIAETRPDRVLVACTDRFHDEYIVRSLEAGCDVITEKPMTIDAPRTRAVLEAAGRTGRKVTVTFNYRYSPSRRTLKSLIAQGRIGTVTQVDFHWMLDTVHGADYFRRWHRRRENSGSLLVHKATHHFDLAHWWIDSTSETVWATGEKRFYRPGTMRPGGRCSTCDHTADCRFYFNLKQNDTMRKFYHEGEAEDGYVRDGCVFDPEIDIWDTMAVGARYANGVLLSYSLVAYAPWEGYRVAVNGTEGRLELDCFETRWVRKMGGKTERDTEQVDVLRHIPQFGPMREIEPPPAVGGHGGGDVLLMLDLFAPEAGGGPGAIDEVACAADVLDGARSVLTGIAACESIDRAAPVNMREFFDWPGLW